MVYFTTDGDGTGYLKCGAINGTLTTVDFGAGQYCNECFISRKKIAHACISWFNWPDKRQNYDKQNKV